MRPAIVVWITASALLMLIGAAGSWISAFEGTQVEGGLHGSGWIVLACSLLAIVALRSRRWAIGIAAGAIGALTSWWFVHRFHHTRAWRAVGDLVHPGWGVYLALGASLSLLAGSAFALARAPRPSSP
jgi:hypothetical protein